MPRIVVPVPRGRRLMHDDHVLVEARIRRELFERVMPAMYSASQPMTVQAWDVPGEPVPYAEAASAEYRPFDIGGQWSRPWGTTWFRFAADVPEAWVGNRLEAVIDLGFHHDSAGFQAEGLLWVDGKPVQGIHPRRTGVPLARTPAGPLNLLVEAASNPAFPSFRPSQLGSPATAGDAQLYRLRRAELCQRDDTVFALLLDVEVLFGLVRAMPVKDARRQRALRVLESAFNSLEMTDISGTAGRARALLAPALDLPARSGAHQVVAVGHAHIDTAWLWPLRETVRKCARTFASAVRLMDDHPEYRFVCSQAAQYDWIERGYPDLFQRIVAKAAAGQWQPVGGMWVEADMNLPSGESLARQLVHGQRYFESRFGVRCREVWIPDVFGYPASAPQIFSAAGCDRFVTQKLSWNKQNRFPHSTFWWKGLDGTEVLTHFPPVDTYNATITSEEVAYAEGNFKEHGWSRWSLMPYGHGNGGGGPTREMVERANRLADIDGLSQIRLGTVDEFFEQVEAEAAAGAPVPVWDGELYFEMHRGTLTSQTNTKVGNRHCERLLREAELWWATGGAVPQEVAAELDALWKEVLLHQFHDIIPGSSIAWVHADTEAAHARIIACLERLIGAALIRLPGVAQRGLVVANAATHARCEVVASATAGAPLAGGEDVQVLADGGRAFSVNVPGLGLAPVVAARCGDSVSVTEHSFANSQLAVSWDLDGSIVSIIDISIGRELLAPGRPIVVELAPDHPVEYDAWYVEAWTASLGSAVGGVTSVEVIDAGPLLATLRVTRQFSASSLVELVTLRAGSARLDITFDIDWHENEQLLSVLVPLEVRAREAACDIQFGHVMRPTHPSTPWDAAKFEVCAHRYVDLSEPSWGVAVLNDGRYGHSLFDGGVRVSLQRAANYPDPTADRGRHQVTIAVLPHGPGLHDVLREAADLNLPLRLFEANATTRTDPPGAPADVLPEPVVVVDHPGVEVSAVKRADDGSGDLIVRMAEMCGDRCTVTVRCAAPPDVASRCNLLEEPVGAVEVADDVVVVALRPFELVTLRLTPA
ncbi:MAG: glycoside hydrolase family 38 C-terminal domain-containing protein [Ilumatobacteraceae bacterium]